MSCEGANLHPENLCKNRIMAFSSTKNNTAKGITVFFDRKRVRYL